MDRRGQSQNAVATSPAAPATTRPRFRERQVLRAADLEVEQSYRLVVRRRHNLGHHGWGIVSGLELIETPVGVGVQPGMAVDGYGRELVVPASLAIPPDAFQKLDSGVLDVWLCYDLVSVNVPQRGSWDCGPGRNNNVREVSRLRLTPGTTNDPGYPKPRSPEEVPFADLPFPPYRIPPDDPAREWPVYLGTIRRTVNASYDPGSPRPYATVTGEVVVAPSGGARMQVGGELETDTRRFAVSVADLAGKFVERLAVDRAGNTVVTGNTTVRNHLRAGVGGQAGEDVTSRFRLRENRLPSGSGPPKQTEPLCGAVVPAENAETPGAARMIHFQPLAETPAAAAPWRIYRTSIKRGGRTIRQLRIEMEHPGDKGDPSLSRIVFGTRDVGGDFNASLTVSADCTVTIKGNVEVSGQVSEGPIMADVSDPRFTALIAEQWDKGTVVGQVKAAPATIEIQVMDRRDAPVRDADVTVENVARNLRQNGLTGLKGDFVAPNLPAGRYNILVVKDGFIPLRQNVDVTANQTLDLLLRMQEVPGSIEGSVRQANPVVAIQNATVQITEITPTTQGLFSTTVSTDSQGRFVAPIVPPGRYRVTVSRTGFNTHTENVDVVGGQTATRDITLTTQVVITGNISGTVVDNQGGAIAGATVDLVPSTGLSRSATTSQEGAFVFTMVAPGSYQLTARANNFNPTTVTVSPGETVTITLTP